MRNSWSKTAILTALLVSVSALPVLAQSILVPAGSNWRYLDTGGDPGADWATPGYNDILWQEGPAELGYGDGDEATVISFGDDANNKYPGYFFRHQFQVTSTAGIVNLRGNLRMDDGAVVYLNGTEVFRVNMAPGVPLYTDFASAQGNDATPFIPFWINPALLTVGNNYLAVEVHQVNATSSDITFDFSLETNPSPSISILTPTEGQIVIGENVTVAGLAVPAGETVTLVEVFEGANKIGESLDVNFSVLWQSVVPGNYVLTAKLTDSSGLTATSVAVNVEVQEVPASVLVPPASEWKYFKGTQEASTPDTTAWRQVGYNDSGWLTGRSPFFYENASGYSGNTDLTSDMGAGAYTCIYMRRVFQVANPLGLSDLSLDVQSDDGCIIFINGVEVASLGRPTDPITYQSLAPDAGGEPKTGVFPLTDLSMLVEGDNLLAVQAFNQSTGSSDFLIELSLNSTVDAVGPTVVSIDPPRGSIQLALTTIDIEFSEPVEGIEASDLLINGNPATTLTFINSLRYGFTFEEPPVGTVNVAFSDTHGITDTSPFKNPLTPPPAWTYTLDPNASQIPNLIITEVVARGSDLQDEDGDAEDWIEILNLGPLAANLDGYYLTDDTNNLTKWRFSTTPVLLGEYLIVWASGKNKTNYLGRLDTTTDPDIIQSGLHTSFQLSANGEYVALVDPSGTHIVTDLTFPAFPQGQSVSYGRDRSDILQVGFYSSPTPGGDNPVGGGGPGFAPNPVFSIPGGFYRDASLSLTLSAPSGSIYYTINGGTPTQSSTLYTGPININNSMVIKARVYQAGLLPGAVVINAYNLAGTGLSGGFTSKLPLVIVNTLGGGEPPGNNIRIPASFTIIDTYRGMASLDSPPQFQGSCMIERRGQSSAGWPKGQYRVEIVDGFGNDMEVPLLDLPEESDWILIGPYPDKALVNNDLAFHLFGEMGHYSVRSRLVEMFLDTNGGKLDYTGGGGGNYVGVYTLVENIKRDNNRVDIAELSPVVDSEPDISGGYIFVYDPGKNSPTDLVIYNSSHVDSGGLKIREPKPDEFRLGIPARTAQLNWIANYLARFEAAAYASDWLTRTGTNHYSSFIDLDTFVDSHWMVEIAKQIDGYRLSNYFTKDRNGKLKMAPIWDWNLAWGNADYLDGGNTNQWYFKLIGDNQHIWLSRLIDAPGDPDFIQRITDRWGVLRTNTLNGPKLLKRLDDYYTLLLEAATRDDARWTRFNIYLWPNPQGPPAFYIDLTQPNYTLIMEETKKWVAGRFNWIDQQFLQAPQIPGTGGDVLPGTFVSITPSSQGTVYYRTDGLDPRAPGGGILAGSQVYTAPIQINENARVVTRAYLPGYPNLGGPWSPSSAATFVISTPPLIITEIMYHPLDPSLGDTNDPSNYEYIELKNIGLTDLSLNRFRFVNGIQFDFSLGTVPSLAPNASVLVVKNIGSFTARYGAAANIAGEFTGSLDNAGERIVLWGPRQEIVHDFVFDDGWHRASDGFGFSLVVADEAQPRSAWGTKEGWRASNVMGGSPGVSNPPNPNIPIILVNEVLTHTDLPLKDSVELYNPNDFDVNLEGWRLSDDRGEPKWQIPPGEIISAHGYKVYDEDDFNVDAVNTNRNFTFRSAGDEVYLFSADTAGNLTGYMHGFEFGAALNGVSFGRHITTPSVLHPLGEEHFVAQSSRTLGFANAGPKVGPVVISEFMYRPPDVFVNNALWDNTEHEFVELHNISGVEVPLYDPMARSNFWTLTDAIDYSFPSNTTINADERILVVSFDPLLDTAAAADFRSRYGLGPTTPRLFGPFSGRLSNAREDIKLIQPDTVVFYEERIVTGVIVDEVDYVDDIPWPVAADGIGSSLQRVNELAYGNDYANWKGANPSPGSGYVPGPAPVIISDPVSQTIVAYQNASFSVGVDPAAGPFQYQWQHNGQIVPNATEATLNLVNVQPEQAGEYRAVVRNAADSAVSLSASLLIQIPAAILAHPQDADVLLGGTTNFSVSASSSTPISYQWRKNGVPIPGAINPILTISGATRTDDALYDVVVSDAVGFVISDSARLFVLVTPSALIRPVSQTAVVGDTVTFSVETDGTLPMGYRWRHGNFTVTNLVLDSHQSFFRLQNVQVADGGAYSVILTNKAFYQPGVAVQGFSLTIQTDTDLDGLSDAYEDANPLILNKNNPADANQDPDGDGLTNKQEQIAGTNPNDINSYLRVEEISAGGGATIEFMAAAGKTYTVAFRDGIEDPVWHKLKDVAARATAGPVVVTDALSEPVRIYTLITPWQETLP